jgi:hypothetical protein
LWQGRAVLCPPPFADEFVLIPHAGAHGSDASLYLHLLPLFRATQQSYAEINQKCHIRPPANGLNFTNEIGSPIIQIQFDGRETASASQKPFLRGGGVDLPAKNVNIFYATRSYLFEK